MHGTQAPASFSPGWPGSAAPAAGLRSMLPELDGPAGSILVGVQGWDLAADSLKELFDVDSVLRTCFNHDGTYGLSIFLCILQRNLPDI